jgi:hypothetical protein
VLLDSPEHQGRVAPQAVLESMIRAFDIARSTIAAIDQAEAGFSARAVTLRLSLDEIVDWSKANGVQLGDISVPGLDAAEHDPLGALDSLGAAEAAVAALKVRRDEAEREIAALEKASRTPPPAWKR